MRGKTHDLNIHSFPFDSVNHPILVVEPRRPVPSPLSMQALVMKPANVSESLRPGDGNDILPFFVPLQEFMGESSDLTVNPSMFEYIPHRER